MLVFSSYYVLGFYGTFLGMLVSENLTSDIQPSHVHAMGKYSVNEKLMIFFFSFFPKNRTCQFKETISLKVRSYILEKLCHNVVC